MIRVDVGLQDRVSVAEWDAVIARMVPALRDDAPGTALLAGVAAMREHFAGKGFQPLASGNRFADGPVEARDP